MAKFQIREEFYLDDVKFKILSGAVHYFRIHYSQWEDTLFPSTTISLIPSKSPDNTCLSASGN